MSLQRCHSPQILGIAVAFLVVVFSSVVFADPARTVEWEELIPKDWNPNSVFDKYTDEEFSVLPDDVYEELQAMSQKMVENAPTVDTLDGERIKIPGFILPLEFEDTNLKEFLLVPYFGACIHVPPPPANQIIHASLESPVAMNGLFTPVWLIGELRNSRTSRSLGEAGYDQTLDVKSGYSMDVETILPYEE